MQRFCPKCGKDIEENIDGFCIDCYLEDHEILTIPVFDIYYCSVCESYTYANKIYKNKQLLEKELLKHIKLKHLEDAKPSLQIVIDDQKKEYFSEVTVRFLINNKIKKIKQTQKTNYKKEICVACSRVAGNYYTSIIQLRFDNKNLQEQILPSIRKRIQKIVHDYNKKQKDLKNQINIVKEKTEKGGVDIYINEQSHAQRIVQNLSKNKNAYDQKYSKTLMGVHKNGKKKFRYTFCIHYKDD